MPCPACQEPQGELQSLVCQGQRVRYLVKLKMKFRGLSREDGSRGGSGTVGRTSEESGVLEAQGRE